jgi:hypothetical protein
MYMQNEIAIVLTGTIIPNSILTSHSDPGVRKQEYLKSIHFYTKFAPVYFLENSNYPVDEDPDFTSIPNLSIRKMPVSIFYEKGKGYQEFEMLDRWLEQEKHPPHKWFKISGRYIFKNFSSVITECLEDERSGIVIDQMRRHNIAFTDIFCIKTESYIRHFKGIYKLCEDISGEYIEKIIYKNLSEKNDGLFRVFINVPRISVISGTDGLRKEDTTIVYYLKLFLRRISLYLSSNYLLYPFMKAR